MRRQASHQLCHNATGGCWRHERNSDRWSLFLFVPGGWHGDRQCAHGLPRAGTRHRQRCQLLCAPPTGMSPGLRGPNCPVVIQFRADSRLAGYGARESWRVGIMHGAMTGTSSGGGKQVQAELIGDLRVVGDIGRRRLRGDDMTPPLPGTVWQFPCPGHGTVLNQEAVEDREGVACDVHARPTAVTLRREGEKCN